ncbi:MAG: hypothetical protein QXP36_08465 [Conexivisphaerales archaeon]
MENKKAKKGLPFYRTLIVTEDCPECEEAIKFMKELEMAYTLWRLSKDIEPDGKLPRLEIGRCTRFEGLEEIKKHKDEITILFPGELIETEEISGGK